MSKILIVDDKEANRYLLQTILTAAGHATRDAANGAEALESARRERPDLIISDILMPQIDGFALCRECKRDETLRDIPFIFYTATYTDPRDRDFGLQLGAARFVVKPMEAEDLSAIIEEVLKEHAQGKSSASVVPAEDEAAIYRLYNEALIRKLEDKMLALEKEIAERRQAEKLLQKLASAVEQAADPIFITDAAGVIEFINPAFERLTGYAKNEVLGNTPRLLKSGAQDDAFYKKLWQVILSGKNFKAELINRKKNGERYNVQQTITPIRDERGVITHFISTCKDMTERRQAEEQINFQAHLLSVVGNAVIATDMQGQVTYWNPAAEKLYGWSAGEALGRQIVELTPANQTREQAQEIMSQLAQGRSWSGEFTVRRKDGSEFPAFVFDTPIVDADGRLTGIIGVSYDVSAHAQAEQQIKRRVIELEALYQSGIAFSQTFDPKEVGGKIIEVLSGRLEWHHAAVRVRRGESREVELLAFSHTNEAEDRARLQSSITQVGQGIVGWVIENGKSVRSGDLSGDPRYTETYAGMRSGLYVPIRIRDKIIGCISAESEAADAFTEADERLLSTLAAQAAAALESARLFQNLQGELTARRAAEEKLRALNVELEKRIEERTADLRQLNNELERALRIKDEFLANMSHELRTPLNAIIGLSESLIEQTVGALNERQAKYVGTIGESGQHLLYLINDILDLAKIEAGQVTLSREKVNISDVCQSSLRMIKQLALKKRLDVRFEMDVDPGMIWADERRLKQMIVNLLSNAVKFTPEGGSLGLQAHGDRENNSIKFVVWDMGIGIAEENLTRLFQPFVQLDSHLTRKEGGTGLGLALVAKMASLHGGSASVESQLGRGSRFTITLPWESAFNTGSLEGRLTTAPVEEAGMEEQVVLLADDTENVILLFKDYLERAGYRVVVARNGVEAVTLAESLRPSLILMDVQMPVMDGMEAARNIRRIPALQHTPIIALTALAMKGDRERCLKAGMNDYLSKPVNLKTLLEMVRNHLSGSAEESRS
jgi:PAS domain S-box-containing protein